MRIIFVGNDRRVLARTKESLIAQDDETACNANGGIIRGINVDTSANTLTFTWKRPECDESKEKIVGYEYSVCFILKLDLFKYCFIIYNIFLSLNFYYF